MDPKTRIRQFVLSNFYVADPAVLGDDVSLLDQGVVDSTGVLEVVGFLETEFGIQVLDEEMLPENLDSVSRISEYVRRKQAARG
jgi:acyl carrier protein